MSTSPRETSASASQPKRHLSSATSIQSISQADLDFMVAEAFTKTSDYLKSQMEGTCDDLKLVQEMNDAVTKRYNSMKQTSAEIAKNLETLNDMYTTMQPYIAQIDEIEIGTKRLEIVACTLDSYVRNLEAKFKQMLDKR